jgi:hypothetical protein
MELKAEYTAGQNMIADLEAKQANLRDTLLRISGAIQVLEEEFAKASPSTLHDLQPGDGAREEVHTRSDEDL